MAIQREQFGSRLGFIMAAAGSAVGIGNLVGFPVAATKNGGGAFLLVYAIFVVFICLPVMMAEMSMGRKAVKNPLGAYIKLSENNPLWSIAGWIAVVTPFLISVFYTVITVWIFGYLVQAVTGNLSTLADPEYFGNFINSYTLFIYMALVAGIIFLILQGGVKQGIEKAAKVLMPSLFVLLLALVGFVLTQDNAMAGLHYYLVPDFDKIDSSVINGALAQAFFSLSLGMGVLLTYGSYLDKRADIVGSAKLVAIADTAVAFTAGLLILPAIFSFNPNTNTAELSDSSVGMIFTFLPKIFLALQDVVGYGLASAIASVFFLLVFFAAITSLVSLIEVPVASLMDEKNMSRRRALSVLGIALGGMAVLSTMSFGNWEFVTKFVTYAGADKSLFDLLIDTSFDTILPLNGLLVCLFVVFRWKKHAFNQELSEGNPDFEGSLLQKYVNFSLSTFIPIVLLMIFVNTVAVKFFGQSLIG